MTIRDEEALREAFATLVPEAPPSVADARPVVRRARQRRTRLIAGVGAAALVAAAVGVPAWLNRPGADDSGGIAVDVPAAPDPWTTLPCSELPTVVSAELDLGQVTAARLCLDADLAGADPLVAPPGDALVSHLDIWRAEIDQAPAPPAPADCAAMSVLASPIQVLVQETDGSLVRLGTTTCGPVDAGGTSIDGPDLLTTYLTALAAQRDAEGDPEPQVSGPVDCAASSTVAVPVMTLAAPVAAAQCPAGKGPVRQVDDARLAVLVDAFASATRGPIGEGCHVPDSGWTLGVLDAYGDLTRWAPSDCGTMVTVEATRPAEWTWAAPLDFSD
jgi:hypothetical protein